MWRGPLSDFHPPIPAAGEFLAVWLVFGASVGLAGWLLRMPWLTSMANVWG